MFSSIAMVDYDLKKILKNLGDIFLNEENNSSNYTLNSGLSGHVLFLATIGVKLENKQFVDKSIKLLEKNIELLKGNKQSSLFIGITGTAWVIRYLINSGILDFSTTVDLIEVDDFLRKIIKANEDKRNGLMYGLTGIGIYFLEKYYNGNESSIDEISHIVEKINKSAFYDGKYISWPDQALFMNGKGEQLHNIGLAHGTPGIISFLSRVYNIGVSKNKIFNIIEGSVEWLLDKELSINNTSLYPSIVRDVRIKDANSRLAWCYGDLCVAKALLDAETVLKNGRCYENALRILNHSFNRGIEEAKITTEGNHIDPTFCHGMSGICHLYNRMYQITGAEAVKQRSLYWLHRLFDSTDINKKGEIEFLGYRYVNENDILWEKNNSLLHGSSGIGLMLSSFLENEKPNNWDNVLLTSNVCYQ